MEDRREKGEEQEQQRRKQRPGEIITKKSSKLTQRKSSAIRSSPYDGTDMSQENWSEIFFSLFRGSKKSLRERERERLGIELKCL